MKQWMGMIVADVNSAADHHRRVKVVESSAGYTRVRRQDLGAELGITKGAPVFRYCLEQVEE